MEQLKKGEHVRARVTNHFLIKSMPTGIYFTEKDCFLDGKLIDIVPENFRRRIRKLDPKFKQKSVKVGYRTVTKFFLTKDRKKQLMKLFDEPLTGSGANPKSYCMKLEGVETQITNMAKFCDDNKLSMTNMRKVYNGIRAEYKGWTKSELTCDKPIRVMPVQVLQSVEHNLFLKVMSA